MKKITNLITTHSLHFLKMFYSLGKSWLNFYPFLLNGFEVICESAVRRDDYVVLPQKIIITHTLWSIKHVDF